MKKLLFAALIAFIVIPSLAFGSENCGMMGGQCRDVCNKDEQALEGAFIDCGEKQECCVYKAPRKEKGTDAEDKGQWKKQE